MANITIRPFNPETPNHTVLNAIRNEATDEYRRRVPAATRGEISATLDALNTYAPNWNEFVSAIINKVGLTIAKNLSWTNPLAKFKRGLLGYGESIEEIQTGLVQAYVYDHDQDYGERAIFGRERLEVQADYHKINRENFYKLTVDTVALKRAFQSETGLAQFVNSMMDAPTTSDNWDEYLITVNLFSEYEKRGGFFKVNIPELPSTGSAQVEARQALRAIRTMAGRLGFPSRLYNAAGMPSAAKPEDLELFCTPEFQAAMDVEAFASLFNVEYAEVPSRVTIVDDFKIPGVQAILTTRDFFVIADTHYSTEVAPNPVGLHTNYFLHHHQIVSFSRFVPAIAFTTGPGTEVTPVDDFDVTSVALTVLGANGSPVTTVERGASYELAGTIVTTPAGEIVPGVTVALDGSESNRSYVTQTVLHVSPFDSAGTITVTATSTDNPDVSGSVTLTVTGDLLRLWPDPAVTPDADGDGLLEVTPEPPTEADGTITIPNVTGVQYKVGGVNVNNGSTHSAPATVTAVARAKYELTPGATASWTFS